MHELGRTPSSGGDRIRTMMRTPVNRLTIRAALLLQIRGSHLGLGEAPKDDPTTRWMIVWKADAATERGQLPTLQVRAALGKLIADLRSDGIYLGGEVLRPGRETKRSFSRQGKRSVIDGPLAESKELISGFLTLELPSVEAALPWAERYVEAVGDIELDIRPLYEASELA